MKNYYTFNTTKKYICYTVLYLVSKPYTIIITTLFYLFVKSKILKDI